MLCTLGQLALPSHPLPAQTVPSIKVAIAESPEKVTTGDPIKGSVVITLTGFSKPVNVAVGGGLSERFNNGFADVPRVIVLHSRPNGSYRLSLGGDLDMRATYKSLPEEILVRANAVTGGRSFSGEDRRPILVQDAKEDLFFAEVSLSGEMGRYTFPLNQPTKVTLNYSIFSLSAKPISGAAKESVRISGPVEKTYPVRSRQVDRALQGFQIRTPLDFTFSKPGEYRVEYELSIEGGKPLKGREILFVPSPFELTKFTAAPGLGSDPKAPAGTPFNFLVKYQALNVVENQCEVVESLEFTGPESVSISPRRLLEGPGDPTWESLYEVKLVKPGVYKWKAELLPEMGNKLAPLTGSLTVTPPAVGGGGKVWTRGDGINDVENLNNLRLAGNSVSWTAQGRDGKMATSTLSWTEPETTLTEGQSVPLKLSFTQWTGPAFEARVFSYAFEGGRNAILSATANNPARLSGERTFVFKGPQPGEPQDQVSIVLQVNYRSGDFSDAPANRLYRSWTYRRGGAASLGAAGIKDKTLSPSVTSPASMPSASQPGASSASPGSLNRSKSTEAVGGLKIGIKDGKLIVTEVLAPTGAEIKAGDEILRVNGKDAGGLTFEQIIALLKDPSSSQITLLIRRSDGAAVTYVTGKRSG